MSILLWLIAATIVYAFVGYSILIAVLAVLFGRRQEPGEVPPLHATLLIAAHNEEAYIKQRIENALSLECRPAVLDILIACDGCTDRTAEIARSFSSAGVKVVESPEHVGKIGVMNLAMRDIAGDVVIFSDANSQIEQSALCRMLPYFSDPKVGGVCGAIGVSNRRRGWLAWGEALHWKLDHAQKHWESQLAGAVSAQGGLYAVRRGLISDLPPSVADDLVMSLRVVAQGYRLVFERTAVVMEGVTESAKAEFGRRVRSTEQGWRGLMMMPQLLNPFRFGFYSVQLFSHKVLRRLVPFLGLCFFVISLMLVGTSSFYTWLAVLEIAALVLTGLAWAFRDRLPGWTLIPVFIIAGNLAMALGVMNVAMGKRSVRWKPARNT